MKTLNENNVLTIYVEGRIDSTNAEAKGAELEEAIKSNAHEKIIIDAQELEYISSAGLRIILKIKKREPELKIINASTEVYEIFDMTGFTEMMTIEKAFRQMSIDGCSVIGQGAKGIIYRYDGDTIVKVYKYADSLPDIKNERELARKAFVLGIPTAISYDIVKVGEKFGSVFELLNAKSFSELIMEDEKERDFYISEYAKLFRQIHSTMVKKEDMPDIKDKVWDWVEVVQPYISENSLTKLKMLINSTPDTLNMLHCDYHTNNVMSQNGETLLIDMDTLSHGHPIFDLGIVCSVYKSFNEYQPSNSEDFLGISNDVCNYLWDKFLPIYLDTEDKNIIENVYKKAKLIANLRVARHAFMYNKDGVEAAKIAIAPLLSELEMLLDEIETLEF